MAYADLPVVDFAPFDTGDAGARGRVARAFGAALETAGFAVVVGHGVPQALASRLYDSVTEFLVQPMSIKARYVARETTLERGYLPVGVESVAKTLTGETPHDLCEALVFSEPHREDRPGAKPNIWPERPSGLSALVREWSSAMHNLTQRMSRISALALELPEDYFADAYADPSLTLRFVNYPDQAKEPPLPGQMRYGEHHDFSALTILRQDAAPGGLQVKHRDGSWMNVAVIPDSFIVNVGDLMALWTNNRWRSTMHRVDNPDRSLTGSTRRLSMVAFTGPNDNHLVSCLSSCVGPGRPAAFAPVTAGDFIRAKLAKSMNIQAPLAEARQAV